MFEPAKTPGNVFDDSSVRVFPAIPRRSFSGFHGAILLSLMIGTVFIGCQTPRRSFQPAQDPAKLNDILFLHYLATVPVVTFDEGLRALLLLIDPKSKETTFEQRRRDLIRRGVVKDSWSLEADQTLDNGTLGYMLRAACRLPRSTNERLSATFGFGERRYALRSCVHAGLLPHGLADERVSGGMLLSAITSAEQYVTPSLQPSGS